MLRATQIRLAYQKSKKCTALNSNNHKCNIGIENNSTGSVRLHIRNASKDSCSTKDKCRQILDQQIQ